MWKEGDTGWCFVWIFFVSQVHPELLLIEFRFFLLKTSWNSNTLSALFNKTQEKKHLQILYTHGPCNPLWVECVSFVFVCLFSYSFMYGTKGWASKDVCAGKLIKTVCLVLELVEWSICLCIDGLVLALRGSCSRFLNPFSYEPLYWDIQHTYFLSQFLFCLWICTYCICPICYQVCNLCGYTVRSIQHLLINRYESTNGQSPVLCLTLHHSVSFIE